MGEIGVSAFKWGMKFSYALATVVLFVTFIAFTVSGIGVALNGSVVLDLLYFTQMWLPFNLNPMLTWLFTSITAYFAYRLSLMGFTILRNVLD